MTAAIQVSIIIVSYNVQDFLDLCLDAVHKATQSISAEVFVVDNQSSDGSVALVRDKYPDVKLIPNQENVGFSKANNQALCLSQGKYVLFLNPDTIIPEDFFTKTVAYLDEHPNVGGIGPRIIDADGNYAADSKKSFPSFWVSVAKVSGLSKAFPKSNFFNKYYAAHVGEYETATVDILSGCCLMVNKANLMQAGGGFDETYFMYCEDVDMCHRLNMHGFQNVYFPEVSIVHYKGESTRKLTFSYMKIFYEAHALFVEKYYPKRLGFLFNLALKSVLVLRNVFQVLKYVFSILKIYLLDALIIVGALFLFRYYWFTQVQNLELEGSTFLKTIPVYVSVWMLSLYFNGAYDKPYSLFKAGRGMLWGTILVLAIYGLFPLEYRHSRAVVLFSGVLSTITLLLARTVFAQLKIIRLVPRGKNDFKAVIATDEEKLLDTKKLLDNQHYPLSILGRIGKPSGKQDDPYLGPIEDFVQLQQVLAINEVVFNASRMKYKEILATMQLAKDKCTYKIIPSNSTYIISSHNLRSDMEVFGLSAYAIGTASSKRNKRLLDIVLSLLLYILAPVLVFTSKKKILHKASSVLLGKQTWIGYASQANGSDHEELPPLKPGVFAPYVKSSPHSIAADILAKIDMKYAKEYTIIDDLQYFIKNVKNL